jgi:MFS family permease
MLATANSLAMVIISRVFDGLFGANLSTAQAAISDVTTAENRARGLGITGAAFGLGFMLGPAISAIALEFTDSLAIPAWIAAAYSAVSILLTLFAFEETLPPEKRGTVQGLRRFTGLSLLRRSQIAFLLALMFAQQVIFYGFETLLGLFALSRIGLLGQGIGFVFVFVGIVLVFAQVRMIGRLTQRYGEAWVAKGALLLLGVGLLLLAATPVEPHPFYVRQILENEIARLAPSGTEAVIGEIAVEIPQRVSGGSLGGIVWLLGALIVIALGAGLIRPSLNSLMTQRVAATDYGAVLGLSAGAVSAANAIAPLLGGLAFQGWGAAAPFVIGGVGMIVLAGHAMSVLRRGSA